MLKTFYLSLAFILIMGSMALAQGAPRCWHNLTDEQVKLGYDLRMSAIEKTPGIEVLKNTMDLENRTGALVFRGGGIQINIKFINGSICQVSSSYKKVEESNT